MSGLVKLYDLDKARKLAKDLKSVVMARELVNEGNFGVMLSALHSGDNLDPARSISWHTNEQLKLTLIAIIDAEEGRIRQSLHELGIDHMAAEKPKCETCAGMGSIDTPDGDVEDCPDCVA